MLRNLLTWLLWILAGALGVLLLAMVIVPRLMGWVPLTVLSGSMEPGIPVGSQVIVKPVEDIAAIETGDVITYMPNPDDATLVTHRVIGLGVDAGGETSLTVKGDANNAPDPAPVTATQLRGVVVYHLPLVGYIATSIGGGTKIAAALIAGTVLLGYAAFQLIQLARERTRRRAAPGGDSAPEASAGSASPVPEASAGSASPVPEASAGSASPAPVQEARHDA